MSSSSGEQGRDRLRDAGASCRRALFAAARPHWQGSRAELRRAVRHFVASHRRDGNYLTSLTRRLAFHGAIALPLLGLAGAGHAAFLPLAGEGAPFLESSAAESLSVPALVDIDGDGDLDLFVGDDSGEYGYGGNPFYFYENTGSAANPAFVKRTGSANPLDGLPGIAGSHETQTFADLDGDGDFDFILGKGCFYSDEPCGEFFYYENTGMSMSAAVVQRTGSANPLDGFDVGNWAAPTFADWDDDGELTHFLQVGKADQNLNALRQRGWVGDALYRPYDATEPITIGRGGRAVSIFELEDLVKLAAKPNKHVVLVGAPCNRCGRSKGDALVPLFREKKLKLWSHVVMDMEAAHILLGGDSRLVV